MAEKIKAQPIQIEQPVDIKITQGTINQSEIDKMADVMAKKLEQAFKKAQSKSKAVSSSGSTQAPSYMKGAPSGHMFSKALKPSGSGYSQEQWQSLVASKMNLASGLGVPTGSLPFMSSNVGAQFNNPLVGHTTKFPDMIKKTPQRHINVADQEFIRNWIETPLKANLDKFSTSSVSDQSSALMKRMTNIGRKKTISRQDFAGAFKMYHNMRSSYIKGSMPGEGSTEDEKSNFEKQLRNLGNIKRLIGARSRVVKEGQSFKDLETAQTQITEAAVKQAAEEVKKVAKTIKTKKVKGFGQLDFGFDLGRVKPASGMPPILPPNVSTAAAAGGWPPKGPNWKQMMFNFNPAKVAGASGGALAGAGAIAAPVLLAGAMLAVKKKMGEAALKEFDTLAGKLSHVFAKIGPIAGKIFGEGTVGTAGPMLMSGFKSILIGAFSGNLLSIAAGIGKVIGAAFTFVIGSVANVAVKITKTIVGSIVGGFKEGFANLGEVTRGISLAAIPLVGRGKATSGEGYNTILKSITSFVGQAHVGSVELSTIAQKYIRINGSAAGLVGYMKAMVTYSKETGEAISTVDDTFLEMSSFFGVNLEKSGANLIGVMRDVFHTSNVTGSELKTIAEWIMPAFANAAGTAEEKMKGVVLQAAKLAQIGVKHPRQVVAWTQTFEQITNPTEKIFQLFSTLGKEGNIFTAPDSKVKGEWNTFYTENSNKLKELLDKKSAAISAGQGGGKYAASLDSQISKVSEAFTNGYQDFVARGLTAIPALDLSEKIGKTLSTNPGFRSQMAQTIGGAQVAAVIEAFKKSQEKVGNVSKKSRANIAELIGSIGELRAVAKSAWGDTFTYLSALIMGPGEGEFLKTLSGTMGDITQGLVPALEATAPGSATSTDSLKNASPLGKAFFGLGQVFKNSVEEGFSPAIVAFPQYIQSVLSGDSAGAAKIGQALTGFISIGLSKMMAPLMPLIKGVAQVIGTLFSSVFSALIDSGFAATIAESFIKGFKQMIAIIAGNTQLMSMVKAFAGVITSSLKAAFLESASTMPLVGFAVGATKENIAKANAETSEHQRTIEDASGATVQNAINTLTPTMADAGKSVQELMDSIKNFATKLRQEGRDLEAETINM